MCGRLRRSLYGFRDAPQLWEAYLAAELERVGFRRGKASAALFYHPELDVRAIVHGGDFVFAGCEDALRTVRQSIDKAFLLKDVGMIGWGAKDAREIRVLNRIVRIIESSEGQEAGVRYEPDPRHAELLVAALGPHPRGGDHDARRQAAPRPREPL